MAASRLVTVSAPLSASIMWLAVLLVPFLAAPHLSSKILSFWLEIGNGTHGPLVAGMAAVLMLQAIANASHDEKPAPAPTYLALLVTAIVSFYSQGIAFETGAYLMLPLQVWALVWIAGGRRRAIACTTSVGLLMLAMPIWDSLAILLQPMAVNVVSRVMAAIGIPVFVDGIVIHIPEGAFEVEEGCSGVAYLIAAVALALFMVGRESCTLAQAAKVATSMAVLAIVTNWIRIAFLIVLGHVTEMQSPLIRDHYWFGWGLFAVLILPAIFLISRKLPHSPAATRMLPLELPMTRAALLGGLLVICFALAARFVGFP